MRLTDRKTQGSDGPPKFGEAEDHLWRINWRQHGYPFCGIYAVSPDNRWPTKIGISQNPVKRLITLQNACWRRLDIAQYRYCDNFNAARAVEKKTHEMLAEDGLLLSGEWFDIRPDKAMEAVEFSANVLGIELHDKVPDSNIGQAIHQWIAKGYRGDIEIFKAIEASGEHEFRTNI